MATKKVIGQSSGLGWVAVIGAKHGRKIVIDFVPIPAMSIVQKGSKFSLVAWVPTEDGDPVLGDDVPGYLGMIDEPEDDDTFEEMVEEWKKKARGLDLPSRDDDEEDDEDPDEDEEDPDEPDDDPEEDEPVRVRPSRR